MFLRQIFARKTLGTLLAEAEGEDRLRRVLGPISLTSLGIGAIIGAGIFVMTGRVAAIDAGPAIMVSFVVAGIGCALAALCYAEFASMAPVAGSAYTYAYATLGEIIAWAIGWDLILEYAMSAATVGAHWTKYFNELCDVLFGWRVPDYLSNDPLSYPGAWCNLPAMLMMLLITAVLVIGIRESARFNTVMVCVKVGVVLFVIAVGAGYVSTANWTDVPKEERRQVEEDVIPDKVKTFVTNVEGLRDRARIERIRALNRMATAQLHFERLPEIRQAYEDEGQLDEARKKALAEREEKLKERLPKTDEDKKAVAKILEEAREEREDKITEKWGIIALLGLNKTLGKVDDASRSNFFPYGFSGVMVGAALVFFAFIGFDSISTHSEEAKKPQRDVPIGIIASLIICTLLYIAVSAVITGMQPYPEVDLEAAVASAFRQKADQEKSTILRASAGLIAAGGLAGMTSVILITLLSQARIFLAMARDGLLPQSVFGSVHEKFRTPHVSTMLTGGVIAVVAAFTPILVLEEMVNIGTLFAFVVVCAAVLLLRHRRPTRYQVNEDVLADLREPRYEVTSESLKKLAGQIPEKAAKALAEEWVGANPIKEKPFRSALTKSSLLQPHQCLILNAAEKREFPEQTVQKLESLKGQPPLTEKDFVGRLREVLSPDEFQRHKAELLDRIGNPRRPFRTPLVYVVGPAGIVVNLVMMLFLSVDSWLRLLIWMAVGLVLYFAYGLWHSTLGKELRGLIPFHVPAAAGGHAARLGGEAVQPAADEIRPSGGEIQPKG
jgi:APA family basic amino acid/polyamine antiporter